MENVDRKRGLRFELRPIHLVLAVAGLWLASCGPITPIPEPAMIPEAPVPSLSSDDARQAQIEANIPVRNGPPPCKDVKIISDRNDGCNIITFDVIDPASYPYLSVRNPLTRNQVVLQGANSETDGIWLSAQYIPGRPSDDVKEMELGHAPGWKAAQPPVNRPNPDQSSR